MLGSDDTTDFDSDAERGTDGLSDSPPDPVEHMMSAVADDECHLP